MKTLIFLMMTGAASLAFAQASSQPAAKSCQQASDCKGMLPRICKKCTDGHTACAHHVCEENKCATKICE